MATALNLNGSLLPGSFGRRSAGRRHPFGLWRSRCERRATRIAEQAHEAAEREAQQAAEHEQRLAQEANEALERAESAERQVALEAEQKAARDARYMRALSWAGKEACT
jgi:hypothetical protein